MSTLDPYNYAGGNPSTLFDRGGFALDDDDDSSYLCLGLCFSLNYQRDDVIPLPFFFPGFGIDGSLVPDRDELGGYASYPRNLGTFVRQFPPPKTLDPLVSIVSTIAADSSASWLEDLAAGMEHPGATQFEWALWGIKAIFSLDGGLTQMPDPLAQHLFWTAAAILPAANVASAGGATGVIPAPTNAVSDVPSATRAVSALARAGQVADRGGLTRAGRALAKHGGRQGSVFPQPRGNPAAINQQGRAALDEIMGNVGRVSPNKFGGLDYFGGSRGGGARFDGQGNFIGFLEP